MDYTKPERWLVKVKRNVEYTTAHGFWGCLHVGSVAIFFLPRWSDNQNWRLEVFTALHRWRWSSSRKIARRKAAKARAAV